jgi:hypothetical protein
MRRTATSTEGLDGAGETGAAPRRASLPGPLALRRGRGRLVVIGVSLLCSHLSHGAREPSSAVGVVGELVHRRRCRGQQHDVAADRQPRRQPHGRRHHVFSFGGVDLDDRQPGGVSCE